RHYDRRARAQARGRRQADAGRVSAAIPYPQFKTSYPAEAARFQVGERVRVRDSAPLGHVRTPFYIRGHAGVIERFCGSFPHPEELAQMRDGLPARPLYRVRFRQKDVWPDYAGADADVIEVEIFQHWLEKA